MVPHSDSALERFRRGWYVQAPVRKLPALRAEVGASKTARARFDLAGAIPVASVDEIGDPKKSSGHYKVSKSVLLTLYSV